MLAARWREIGDKVVALAEAFPEDRYEMHPVDGARSFAEQLRHVAFWNQYLRGTLHGEQPDGSANTLPREAHATKAQVVRAVRESFDVIGGDIDANGVVNDPAKLDAVVSYIGHNAEHYGQLAVYLRLCGIVPPASR
jgi:uncharacterized damage-inducible protein DinB